MLLLAVSIVVPAAGDRRRAAYPAAPPCAEAVIASPFLTVDLAIDGSYIYFADDNGGLFRAARNGGQILKLAQLPGDDVVSSLAVDDTSVYFIAVPFDGFLASIDSVSKSGGPVSTLVAGAVTPFDLLIDGDFVYWNSLGTPSGEDFNSDGTIERVRKNGTQHTTIASGLSYPLAMALDGDNVLFGETGLGLGNPSAGLRSVAKSGGTVTSLLDGLPVLAITSDANRIYAGTFNVITSGASIVAVDRATKAATTLTTETGCRCSRGWSATRSTTFSSVTRPTPFARFR